MEVQWWSILPFVTMLLCIALAPLIPAAAHHWEHQRVQLLVALVLGVPVALWFILGGDSSAVVHALIEYAQFISLLLALFVVSGGIFLKGDIAASPRNNTLFLAFGGLIASFIGTTGAAMLLIRPLLNTNQQRKYRVHTVVFAIFIVANCGGLLTPLGDPPLFLGMLRGVPFTWTFGLWPMWLFVNLLLLLTYYALDCKYHSQERPEALTMDRSRTTRMGVKGIINFAYLAVIVGAVALAPSIDIGAIEEGQAAFMDWVPLREIIMLSVAAISYLTGDKVARFVDNKFKWGPILEVAAIFIGIFLTMIPALKYLAQAAPSLPLNEVTFYFFTGGLSSVLDNAPTYVTFFEMARELGGEPAVAGVYEPYLVAISLGAVFFGAVTYIGNGPNFMVKAVADGAGVRMPTFGAYVLQALIYLVPILVAVALIFIADPLWAHVVGWLMAAAMVIRAVLVARSHVHPVKAADAQR
ncbi:sodium:proton antiporter [Ornithinimicrobium cryptoxanthini]|uniref:Sodium:proton antiporter n=1 Tax=Ornithinimicrobium cryptoxanthini TaxID=2934161 RepID=A0ABY4YIN9_9MICO|nr:sodium:proton antiporter [Ornithinimicrobium cryptoxanthini]USQ76642.1 sodium:proton antiporter [Ornithinimicrobium cryptoxanthini]